jgi:DNA-binding transcriptional MocR family regulator
MRARAVAARAAEAGIRVQALDGFAIDTPAPNAIALGLGQIAAARIDAAVARLCRLQR